jgi:ABC-type transporter Mla subunit MlaD
MRTSAAQSAKRLTELELDLSKAETTLKEGAVLCQADREQLTSLAEQVTKGQEQLQKLAADVVSLRQTQQSQDELLRKAKESMKQRLAVAVSQLSTELESLKGDIQTLRADVAAVQARGNLPDSPTGPSPTPFTPPPPLQPGDPTSSPAFLSPLATLQKHLSSAPQLKEKIDYHVNLDPLP